MRTYYAGVLKERLGTASLREHGARLVILRTFLQPVLDYGAPLFTLRSLDSSVDSATVIAHQNIWANVIEAHNRAVACITKQRTYSKILHSILGWLPIPDRCYTLLTTASCQSPNNPHLKNRQTTMQSNGLHRMVTWKLFAFFSNKEMPMLQLTSIRCYGQDMVTGQSDSLLIELAARIIWCYHCFHTTTECKHTWVVSYTNESCQ